MPRFQGVNLETNLQLVEKVRAFANARGMTPAQVALAWVLFRDGDIIPLVGTRSRKHLEQAIHGLEFKLSSEELAELEAVLPRGAVAGTRYPEALMKQLNR